MSPWQSKLRCLRQLGFLARSSCVLSYGCCHCLTIIAIALYLGGRKDAHWISCLCSLIETHRGPTTLAFTIFYGLVVFLLLRLRFCTCLFLFRLISNSRRRFQSGCSIFSLEPSSQSASLVFFCVQWPLALLDFVLRRKRHADLTSWATRQCGHLCRDGRTQLVLLPCSTRACRQYVLCHRTSQVCSILKFAEMYAIAGTSLMSHC